VNPAAQQRRETPMEGDMNERMGSLKSEEGFTLFELLIVIIILAILSGIVAFAVGSTRSNSVSASCSSDAKAFGTALEEYKAIVGVFPGATALQLPANTAPQGATPQPLPNYGETWGLRTQSNLQLANTYGILGNISPTATSPTWTAPNGQVVGAFMRQLPNTTHYQIVTDGQGGVFVYPPGVTVNIGAAAMDGQTVNGVTGNGDTSSSLNFETNPGICGNTSIVS
jgi:prepilin-type N-terminal cleavage/methylation domain-containing protein